MASFLSVSLLSGTVGSSPVHKIPLIDLTIGEAE
jgi:hypothetical protein